MALPTLSSTWAWGVLLLAGLLECAWAIGLKHSGGFARLWPTIGTVLLMVASFVLLAWAVRTLPVGTAYAAWTGIGAAGVALAGIMLFGEAVSARRLFFILVIVVGVVGLKLTSPT